MALINNISRVVSCAVVYALYSPTLVASANEIVSETKLQQTVTAKQALKKRLGLTTQFSGSFEQQVVDNDGNNLQLTSGKLAVKKPNLVYWHTEAPDESTIISDGAALWFYDPFVEQATVYNVKAAISNTPILLLSSNDETLWQQYSVESLTADEFVIRSNDHDSRVKSLQLEFEESSSTLKMFSILDSTGQTSIVTISDVNVDRIDSSLFKFTIPEGVYLDDQR